MVWHVQSDQVVATGTAGMFVIKRIEVTSQQVRFYYIFQSTHHDSLRVIASVSLPSNPAAARSLAAADQVLGQISAYTIGVIHVARINRTNHLIDLQLTAVSPTGAGVDTWHLAPFKQLMLDPHPGSGWYDFRAITTALPEVPWYDVFEGMHRVSNVKVIIPGQPVADRSYLFVSSDDPVKVLVITKAQYLSIAGPANFTP
jgi:hypothetical protein